MFLVLCPDDNYTLTCLPSTQTFLMFLSSARNTNLLTISLQLSLPNNFVLGWAEIFLLELRFFNFRSYHSYQQVECQLSFLDPVSPGCPPDTGDQRCPGWLGRGCHWTGEADSWDCWRWGCWRPSLPSSCCPAWRVRILQNNLCPDQPWPRPCAASSHRTLQTWDWS